MSDRRREIIRRCEAAGWRDVHGGPEEGGMFWRGVSPITRRMEAIPPEVFETDTVEQHKIMSDPINNDTPEGAVAPAASCSVVFGPPPSTGAQKCCECGGWLLSDVSYWDGAAGPFCRTCASPEIEATTTIEIPLEWTEQQVAALVEAAEKDGWIWTTFSQQRMRFIYLPNTQTEGPAESGYSNPTKTHE